MRKTAVSGLNKEYLAQLSLPREVMLYDSTLRDGEQMPGVTFKQDGEAFETVTKTLVDDLMDDLQAPNGLVLEKVEGMTVLPDGTTLVVNDNDGVDDSNGETQLLRIDGLF